MKKIFFFIAAMVVVMTANAAIINGTPNGEERGRVNWWVNGEGQAQAGDTIVLADGVYYESTLTIEKDVVIMAAEGAKPEINIARVYGCVKLAGPASVTFDGITFNGNDSVKYMIAVTGADVKKLTVNNCEFKNWTYWAISNQFEKGASIDSVIVENSVFHDGLGSAVRFSEDAPEGKHACNYLKVANSTLYNITSTDYAAIIQANSNGEATGEQNEIIIDHITLYNFDASDLGAISSRKSSKLTISNSIIATPENKEQYAFYIYGGNVNNTLYFNGKAKSGPTYTDCLTVDPLFVNAANGNFALAEGSPALGAGTDGSNLGDPRWNAPVVEEPVEPEEPEVEVNYETFGLSNLEIEDNGTFWVLTASDASVGLEVTLGVNTADASLMAESQILFNGEVLPILSSEPLKMGYNEELSVDTYTARVVVGFMGGKLGLELVMYASAASNEPVSIFATGATAAIADDGWLVINGTWNDLPLVVRVAGYEDAPFKEYTGVQVGEMEFGVWDETESDFGFANSVTVIKTGDNLDVMGEFISFATNITYNVSVSATFASDATALDNVEASVAPVKVIENGQIFIIRNGVKYNAQGAQL